MHEKRFAPMAIPADGEDGTENATWFVYDRLGRTTVRQVDDFEAARKLAAELNRGGGMAAPRETTIARRQLVRAIEAMTARMTGRRYRAEFEALDTESLRSLQQLLRDLEAEIDSANRRARMFGVPR